MYGAVGAMAKLPVLGRGQNRKKREYPWNSEAMKVHLQGHSKSFQKRWP